MEQKNELYHYGVKGMKWGEHKFGDDAEEANIEAKNAESAYVDIVRQLAGKYSEKSSRQASEARKRLQDAKVREYVARRLSEAAKSGRPISDNDVRAATNTANKEVEIYMNSIDKQYGRVEKMEYDEKKLRRAFSHGQLVPRQELWQIALQEKGLYHIGRSKRDGAPHGSGRYPLGSGDRPNQYKEEAKAEQYRQREIGKIEKRQAKAAAKSEKKSNRLASKYVKAKTKGASNEKLGKIATKYQQERARARFESFIAEQEKKAVSKMSVEDISKEKVAVGKQWAQSVLLTSMTLVAPTPVKVIFRPNISKMKTNRRVNDEDKLTKGMERSVRGSISDSRKLVNKNQTKDGNSKPTVQAQIETMKNHGYSIEEISKRTGIPASHIDPAYNRKKKR